MKYDNTKTFDRRRTTALTRDVFDGFLLESFPATQRLESKSVLETDLETCRESAVWSEEGLHIIYKTIVHVIF